MAAGGGAPYGGSQRSEWIPSTMGVEEVFKNAEGPYVRFYSGDNPSTTLRRVVGISILKVGYFGWTGGKFGGIPMANRPRYIPMLDLDALKRRPADMGAVLAVVRAYGAITGSGGSVPQMRPPYTYSFPAII